MNELDFRGIANRFGDQRDAFEELVCQLARRYLPAEADYTRLRGAGGDGGVECYADYPDGSRVGWQAKYVFDIDALITQATDSLNTALRVHPTLKRYVVCFPFDLTGPTGRRGRTALEKFDEWRQKHQNGVAAQGNQVTIEAWPASRLRELLIEHDTAGGMRAFFFNETILSSTWFANHFETIKASAGPRYTPELSVETEMLQWLAGLGRTESWRSALTTRLRACRESLQHLVTAVQDPHDATIQPRWPQDALEATTSVVARAGGVLRHSADLIEQESSRAHASCLTLLDELERQLSALESRLVVELEDKHGKGLADSPGFRQFMAEYMVSFPTANLDRLREAATKFQELHRWLRSPAGSLAFVPAFVLTGAAGAGKTHGVCDVAAQRLQAGLLTCVLFGHVFRGQPDPWTRTLETLGLPLTLGREGLLEALNCAGEASGSPLVICIDAINETRPLRYWRDHLAAVVQAVQRKRYLRLCITCRTSYMKTGLPDNHGLAVVEHHGFSGIGHYACKQFFMHYGLKPPIVPILQPELLNPLYLRLLCETLRARGLDRLPAGWFGLMPVITAFLEEKELQFAVEYETRVGAGIIRGSLRALARSLAESGDSVLPWSHALQIVSDVRPQAAHLPVLEWLVHSDLLIEDASGNGDIFGDESAVRPAFERLGDFLIADSLLDNLSPAAVPREFRQGGRLHSMFAEPAAVMQNAGIVGALSILISERVPGLELPSLVKHPGAREEAVKITVRYFAWRDPATFSSSTCELVEEGLGTEFARETLETVLAVSWQPSAIDAVWFDDFLGALALATRDAAWCAFLHDQYDGNGVVRHLIDGALELPVELVEADVAERWSTILLWFTAASDRRVKDRASRAAVALLTAHPNIVPAVLECLLDCNDEEVRERALLASYGALINARDAAVVHTVTKYLHRVFRHRPDRFDNALLRDHIRCIAELAQELGVLPDGCDPELTMRSVGGAWPLNLPSDDDIASWKALPRLARSCLEDDFFIYSLSCLRPWQRSVPKRDMGRWILGRVASGLQYAGSGCEDYDRYVLGTYGGGRGKPTWAERIGKKYQWVAMYQLASRLHDHVDRKPDLWTPEPRRRPLILLEERRLDPTLPAVIASSERDDRGAWWIRDSADLRRFEHLSDSEWVSRTEDLPALDNLLAPQDRGGQSWRLVTGYPSWSTRKAEQKHNEPYRRMWMNILSFLIPKQAAPALCDRLHRRNFFGGWMPDGATWLYGFAGEYPWATPFNLEPDEWYRQGGSGKRLPASLLPSWNDLAAEWEYDASFPRTLHLTLPARAFFALRDLWWNGRDGYRLLGGKTVFRDPSVLESGPTALLADAEDLVERLDKLGLSLIWALLGEKQTLGVDFDGSTPGRTFSQIARLREDGSVDIGDRVFFDDYDKNTGLLPVKRVRRSMKGKSS